MFYSSSASCRLQEAPSQPPAPVRSFCWAIRPVAALKALLRLFAYFLGWKYSMKLKFDICPRKASFCRTANCLSSSWVFPGERMGNSWHLIHLGSVLRALCYIALMVINAVLTVANMPPCDCAWLQLSGGINPGTQAFGTRSCCADSGNTQDLTKCPEPNQGPCSEKLLHWGCASSHLNLLFLFCSLGRTRMLLIKSSRTWMKMEIPKWTSKNLSSLWQLWLAAVTNILSRMQPNSCQITHISCLCMCSIC